jgi:glycosyltransferase involved in cell wall biosynthesis
MSDDAGPGPPAGGRKPHVMVVGHLLGRHLYGAERSLLDILAAVDRRQFDLSCVFPGVNQGYLEAVARHTANISVLPYRWWSDARPVDEDAVARFATLFERERVDLVHVNTITLMDPLVAARRLGLPSILHARELVDQDDQLAGRLGGDRSAIPPRVVAAADFVIANSDATHRLYRKPGRSVRLYNCVDLDRFDLPNRPAPGQFKVGMIGSNAAKKGIDHFAELAILAARHRPDLEFLAFGPPTDESGRLEQALRERGASVRLRFAGYVEDPVEAIRQVNLVMSLSLFGESFGRTIAEAMAARRPVIAYDGGAVPELVGHGREGFLLPHRAFDQALAHLGALADHSDRLAAMGEAARDRARRLFATGPFAVQLNAIYREVVERWGRPRARR